MRRLLQSKIATACLLIAASTGWFVAFRQPAPPMPPVEVEETAETEEMEESEAFEPLILPPPSIISSLRHWDPSSNALARVDPFAYPEPSTNAPTAIESMPAPPVLRAISIARRPLAVVDRSVVGVGDRIGPWLITRIEADFVRVEGPDGAHELRLTRGPVPHDGSFEQRSNLAGAVTGEKSPAVGDLTSGPNNGMP